MPAPTTWLPGPVPDLPPAPEGTWVGSWLTADDRKALR